MNYNYEKPKIYEEIEEEIINPGFEGEEEYN
jgi:hypothetical protein